MAVTTIPTAAPSEAPSTERAGRPAPPPRVGDVVLVRLSAEIERPLMVTFVSRPEGVRICGTLHCEPEDHRTDAFCGAHPLGDMAQIYGRPTVHTPVVYAFMLQEGNGIREWRRR